MSTPKVLKEGTFEGAIDIGQWNADEGKDESESVAVSNTISLSQSKLRWNESQPDERLESLL